MKMEMIIILSNKEIKGMDTFSYKVRCDAKHNNLAQVAFDLYSRLSASTEFVSPFRHVYTTKYMRQELVAGMIAKLEAENPSSLVFSTLTKEAVFVGVRSAECSAGLQDGQEYAVSATHYMFRVAGTGDEWSEISFTHPKQDGRTLCIDLKLELQSARALRKAQQVWKLEYIYSSEQKLVEERKHMRFLVSEATGFRKAEGFPLLGTFTISDTKAAAYETKDLCDAESPSLGSLLYTTVLPEGREPNAKNFMAQVNELFMMAQARMRIEGTRCIGATKQSLM